MNLARGLDHGLQSYVDTRAALLGDIDLATIAPDNFGIITDDPALQAELASVYDSVHDVDLWVGGLAEDAVEGGQMGPHFTYIIAEQFDRTRAADEGFGQLDPALGADIIAAVQTSTFADIIGRNTDIDTIQDDPFLAVARTLTDAPAPESTWDGDDIALVALNINDDVETHGGGDHVTVSGGTQISGDVDTGTGDDSFKMTSGDIGGDLLTRADDDTVDLSGTARIAGDVTTGWGDDTVTMDDMAHIAGSLRTNAGKDVVTLNGKSSVTGVIGTGKGDDTVTLSDDSSAGSIRTGMGNDTIKIGSDATADQINGGMGLDRLEVEGPYRVAWGSNGPDGGAGTITFVDQNGVPTGKEIPFRKIEMITCFTPGTLIAAQRGHVKIEDLCVGDKVWTMDDGLQPIRWMGRTTVQATGDLAPIRIAKGALGNTRDLVVSPQHRMLLNDWRVALYTAEDEALVPAVSLINDTTITRAQGGFVTYIHMCFAAHQIVLAEGIPSESFLPAPQSLGTVADAAHAELLRLFPELTKGRQVPDARPILSGKERQVIGRLV